MIETQAPFRRIYIDLPAAAAARLDELARQRGVSKKALLAALIIDAAGKPAAKKPSVRPTPQA